MRSMPTRAERLRAALIARFQPTVLEVIDESARHAGHAGAGAAGETHYVVLLVAPTFEGLSRVARQRAVNEALAEEFQTGLHALSLVLRTPQEQAAARP